MSRVQGQAVMTEGPTLATSKVVASDHADPAVRLRPTVSVVLVTYYTGPLLWRALDAILKEDTVREVVVVDNGNWPETVANLIDMAAMDARIKVVTGHGNVGFAAGCNKGAAVAEGPDLFIVNPDAIVPTGSIATLREEGYRVGGEGPWMIGGRLVNPDGTEQAGARRGPLTPWTAMVEILRLDRLAPRHPYFRRFNNHCDARPDETIATPVISGACMLLPLADYQELGGMDERYFLHAEDVDFCLRFGNQGGKILFSPHVDIVHQKSSSRADKIRVEQWKAQSLTRYFRTHFPNQYPLGFVSLVCGVVWAGWVFRSLRISCNRTLSLFGLNRRRGRSGMGRALRAARRVRNR